MISPARRALLQDALYQVVDNWVFRILLVLTTLLVLSSFAVGIREDGIELLFGVKRWSYGEVMGMLGRSNAATVDGAALRGPLIDGLLEFLFNTLVGSAGVVFCVAATAFFVPQMIEKGAADVLLHKPLRRLTFYLSRYLSGLLFVGILAAYMAVGIYLGLWAASGYRDPGILFAAPLLVYLFGLVYAVAMLVGVLTRSTVAAILLTTLFFIVNGAVHLAWRTVSMQRDGLLFGTSTEEERDVVREEAEDPLLAALWKGLSVAHYALPKTADADVLSNKLRRAVNAPLFREEISRLAVFAPPEGLEPVDPFVPESVGAWGAVDSDLRALLGEARLSLGPRADAPAVRATLLRRPLERTEVERLGRMRTVRESRGKAADRLRDALVRSGVAAEVEEESGGFGRRGRGDAPNLAAAILSWPSGAGEASGARHAVVFRILQGEWIYTLWIEDDVVTPAGERRARREALLNNIGGQLGFDTSVTPYEARFSFAAPWRYNILFSLGSSLAFVALVLLLGWWRLSRIDF